jgi:hypothetical protein
LDAGADLAAEGAAMAAAPAAMPVRKARRFMWDGISDLLDLV